MDHPVFVPGNNRNGGQQNHDQTCTKQPPATTRHKESTPITQESDTSSSINTVEIVSFNDISQAAFSPSTVLKYQTYQIKWNSYCIQNTVSNVHPKISELPDHFIHLYNSGASCSAISSSKRALSPMLFLLPYSSILEDPQIIKYFKGVCNLSPPTQKITFAWDVKILFDYFNQTSNFN